jgi:murein DD-endopeptidase MepM/ murein hydrolase activator NlpD
MAVAMLSLALWQQQTSSGSALSIEPADTNTSEESWQVPLAPPVHLINPYLQPNSDYSAGHRGIDYRVYEGQSVLAPTDATVWFVGKVVDRGVLSLRTASGDLVAFEPVCSELKPGDRVKAGQPIASVCAADSSYRQHCEDQPCLHFSLRGPEGYLSPIVRIGGYSPTVLLPLNY